MPSVLVAQQEIQIGCAFTVEGDSPSAPCRAVFEDDGQTGYFYAVDTSVEENPIQDAVLVYNVADVEDRGVPSTLQIVWSADGQKVVLLLNEYPLAAFDFSAARGYSRTGFPPVMPGDAWERRSGDWDDEVNDFFA